MITLARQQHKTSETSKKLDEENVYSAQVVLQFEVLHVILRVSY